MSGRNEIELESTDCDLCGSNKTRFVYKMPDLRFRIFYPEYAVVECLKCGHRYLNPRPSKVDIHLFYPGDYFSGRRVDDHFQAERYTKQSAYLPKKTSGRILDIGCAGGGWLKTLQSTGWQCYGQDFIRSSYNEPGIDIRYGYLPEMEYPSYYFDVVAAWGVLEHIHEPSRYIKSIHRLLKRSGVFIFMVPNGDSFWSRWAFKEDIPRHLHFFRPKTLALYADRNNFKIEKIEFTNNIYSKPATGRGMIRRQWLKKLGAGWEDLVGTPKDLMLNITGKMCSLIDHLLIHPYVEEKMGRSGNMVAIFKKV